MNKTIRVDVTQEDIFNGVKCSSSRCPVAQALKKIVKPEFYFSVGISNFTLMSTSPFKILAEGVVSSETKDFIKDFDRGFKVKPFSFDLTIPEKYPK